MSRVLIRPADLARIRDGEVDLAFRRWERPRLLVGTRMRTAVGLVEVTSVDEVDDVSDEDAARAGAPREQLLTLMERKAPAPIWRVGLRYAGEDPRVALRNAADLTAEERADLLARLERLDRASRSGPWTREALALIAANPARRGTRPGRRARSRDRAVQARRAQAQGARADRVARDRLPAVATRCRAARGTVTLPIGTGRRRGCSHERHQGQAPALRPALQPGARPGASPGRAATTCVAGSCPA